MEEKDVKNLETDMDGAASEAKISHILDDIRDLKHQMKSSQSQIAYLLYNEADRQRTEVAGNFMVKTWWQYTETNEQGKTLLIEHREAMISAIVKESEISERDIAKFQYEHRRGKHLSPFTMVDTGNYAIKQQLLESINQKYAKKGIKELTNTKLN